MDKARHAAVAVIFDVIHHGAYSNIALNRKLRAEQLSDIDRRFCTELVNGTIKCGASLDWIISNYVNRPLNKIEPKVLAILRLGVYQLFFLDKIPPSAAVNESVELAKGVSIGASKFVNGVLRSMLREPSKTKFPTDDSPASLALRTFHPQWLVERWIKQFGLEQTKILLDTDNQSAPVTLRANRLKITRAKLIEQLKSLGVDAQPSQLVEEGIVCKKLGALDNFEPLTKGLCLVQDESSMLAARVLDPQPGEFIIDCCAAPGGKSTHIAELMDNRGLVIAIDIHEHKLKLIMGNTNRLGVKIVKPMELDAQEVGDEFKRRADRVLVDAPCSGLGVLRRKADLRWRKTVEELSKLPELQSEILNSAAKAVKSGGVIVYSTCTLERAENEGVVEKFLSEHEEFELETMKTLLPHVDGTDGFFYAKLKSKS